MGTHCIFINLTSSMNVVKDLQLTQEMPPEFQKLDMPGLRGKKSKL